MKHFSIAGAAAFGVLAIMSFPTASRADDYDKKTIITITEPLEVPGITLQPGKYVLKLLNSSSNRHIVEVMNERMDHLYALTFTAAARKIQPKGKTVLTYYEGKGSQPHAIRQWFWPGDLDGQEFLYPHKQAERISASAGVKVPEGSIPTSKESGEKLIADNAAKEETTAAVETKPAQTTPVPAAAETTTASRAVVTPPAPEPAPRTQALNAAPAPEPPAPQVSATPPTPQEPVTVAKTTETDTLPQTASSVPMIALAGAIALLLALSMSIFTRRTRA